MKFLILFAVLIIGGGGVSAFAHLHTIDESHYPEILLYMSYSDSHEAFHIDLYSDAFLQLNWSSLPFNSTFYLTNGTEITTNYQTHHVFPENNDGTVLIQFELEEFYFNDSRFYLESPFVVDETFEFSSNSTNVYTVHKPVTTSDLEDLLQRVSQLEYAMRIVEDAIASLISK